MPQGLTPEKQLRLISSAWGRQTGYCFFPWISGKAKNREERIKSYHEGEEFFWPRDRAKIISHMKAHQSDDLYWCPSLFEGKRRQMELAMDEHALWADLDAVDPREIEDYPPTIAWETSPGRYQGLWLIVAGDMQGASWQGGENQRLTYLLGADQSGWDTTQLLRIPGWKNHKFDHRGGARYEGEELDPPVPGKLLWSDGRRYLPDEFVDLPDINTPTEVQTVLEEEIDRVKRHEVWGRVRLKLPHRARELFAARTVSGDRSEQLWWMMRCLADVGCSAVEIVALVRPTPWNKFEGRQDELKRLTNEASKAIGQRSEESTEQLELEAEDKPELVNLFDMLANVRPPAWLIQDLWAIGSCGFIAGQPKSFKSWIGLDLALSVSTGIPFLDYFPIRQPGPVLYIQEEDAPPMVKGRVGKVWPSKQSDKMKVQDGQLVWDPPDPRDKPKIAAAVGEGFVISDPSWQAWLDEKLDWGYGGSVEKAGEPFAMVIIDPLMMVAGDVEENRSQEMTEKIFKPAKQLSRKHEVAFCFVHHMRKGDPAKPQRGGQLMLGSVANHAWAEDSLYLKLARGGDVIVERESKNTTSGTFRITGLRNKKWTPGVTDDQTGDEGLHEEARQESAGSNGSAPRTRSQGPRKPKALQALEELGVGQWRTGQVAEQCGITPNGAKRQLDRLVSAGKVKSVGAPGSGRWELP